MSAILKGLDVDENKSYGNDEFIVYVDGKPGMKYDNSFEAREVVKLLQAKYPQKNFTIEKISCKSERIAEKMKMGADSDASSAGSFKMGEDFAPTGTFTQTAPQTNAPPRQVYSIVLQGKPGKAFMAQYAWQALENVFPNDYPKGSEAAQQKVVEVSQKGSAVVKSGITSRDIADSLVAKLSRFRVPANCWRIVGGELEESSILKGIKGVAEELEHTPSIGINVRNDGDIDYASLIVDGKKKYESRKTDSLRPYVGKTVAIVRTGSGVATAIGQVTIGEPIVVNAEKFDKLRKQHLVPQGSKFDIAVDGTKYLYPMNNPRRWDNEKVVQHKGIVARKIQEQGVAEVELDEACWKGYHKEGNKKMFGKTYPNCVKNTNEEQELDEYGDTPKGQKILTKVQKRAVDRVTSKKADTDPKYAKKNQDTANAAWERMKDKDITEEKCPHCGGPMFSEMIMNEKKDACYYKVKSRYKVWPSAYASGALVKCRKKGASNWGTGGKSNESVEEELDENLHKWFKEKWVRFGPDGKIRGACARGDDSEGKPKCLPQKKAQSLGKEGRKYAASKKRREDPNPERSGKAINVATKKKSNEAANPAQQAAIAIAMKKKGQKPKNEAQGDTLLDPEYALPQARRITKAIKYDDTVGEIITQIQMLAERTEGVDMKSLEYAMDDVREAKHKLESVVYGLDEVFEEAARNAQYKRDEEELNEGPSIFSNSNGGQSYRKFKPKVAGTFNEMDSFDNATHYRPKMAGTFKETEITETPTDNPTGASGEGGWRTYKAKSAGTFPKKESAIFKGLRESNKG